MRYLPALISALGLVAFIAAIVNADQRGILVVIGGLLLVLAQIVARRMRQRGP